MFTGIVSDLGSVRAIERGTDEARLAIETAYDVDAIAIGASIACSGACLTVVETGPGWFATEVSAETLARTTLGDWRPGTPVNLERPLKASDELGGHIVLGHVDGVGAVVERAPVGGSARFVIAAPEALAPLIAAKGSVAVDGVSLTVNRVEGARFEVNIIPHTLSRTTFGTLDRDDRVNLEVDVLARYVARLQEAMTP